MVRVVVAARSNRVSHALPVIVSDGLNGYSLSGDGRRPPCRWDLLAAIGDQPHRTIPYLKACQIIIDKQL